MTLANGQLVVVGGNQPVTWGGNVTIAGGPDPYKDQDGGMAIRYEFLRGFDPTGCNIVYHSLES